MSFSEYLPSKQWATLSYKGERFAEVWFKPEGEPFTLKLRIPQKSFQTPSISQLLTLENLLKAVNIAPDEVESWRHESDSPSGIIGYQSELRLPLPPLPHDVSLLYIHIHMKPPVNNDALNESKAAVSSHAKWENLETRWNTILGVEATIDSYRLRMESLRAELETATSKTLTSDEKLNALNADVAQWNKAKSRARYTLPKLKEFLHRATWAMDTAERKRLAELFKPHAQPDIELSQIDSLQKELENFLKDRQILSAQGVTAYQDGKSGCEDIQRALSTLQRNAAANAIKKRVANRAKGKIL